MVSRSLSSQQQLSSNLGSISISTFNSHLRYFCSWNTVLSILLRRGRTNMTKEVYDEMLRTYGVTPDTCTYNVLIRGLCKNSMVDEGFRFFNEMAGFDCNPDGVTYNTLVDGLCRAGKVRIARNLVNGMSKKCEGLHLDVVTYTTLIRGYCMKLKVDETLIVLEEMSSRGIEPNMVTYNTLIKGLCEAHKLDKMKDLLERMTGNGGFSPDTFTFNTIIHSHCCAGNLDEALKVFESMKKFRVPMDSASYSTRYVVCVGKGTMIWQRCWAHKIPRSYNTLIMGHCKEGAYESGYELLMWMLRRDFLPDVDIYDRLIDGFLLKDKSLLAKETLEKMLKSSYQPKTFTWHSILGKTFGKRMDTSVKIEEVAQFLYERGKLLEACKLLLFSLETFGLCYELVENGLCQELTCLNDLIAALEEGGRREEVAFISKRLPRLENLDVSKGNHSSKKFMPIKV
ncbi:unnamed protein product [Sphenostylis stenocarpa]|uniref:Pentatricopeptide repeat-containing protein n=1 Tax=Sphenostylis stenocarpa TaxID=92480 RepID=A0AA86SU81_9FABA|nr:unnamed protein product [Sphenostylis stenocarpa]